MLLRKDRKGDGVKLCLADCLLGEVIVGLDSGSCFGQEQAVWMTRNLFSLCYCCFFLVQNCPFYPQSFLDVYFLWNFLHIVLILWQQSWYDPLPSSTCNGISGKWEQNPCYLVWGSPRITERYFSCIIIFLIMQLGMLTCGGFWIDFCLCLVKGHHILTEETFQKA